MATAAQPRTAVAVADAPSPIAVALLEGRSNIEDLLPEGMALTRVIAAVKLEAIKNPQLLVCTPISLVTSVGRIAQWGLEIGVTAFLVPFKDTTRKVTEAVPIAGYKGLAELMVASRAVRAVQAKAVFENDRFEYELGLIPKLQHMPESDPAKRGALKGAYCILRLAGGSDVFDYMSIEEIDAIRKQFSKQWGPDKVKDCPPWYAKKTVIRRASELMPKNPRLAKYFSVLHEDVALERADPVEATIVSTSPAGTSTDAATGDVRAIPPGANEEQIARILDLVAHDAIEAELGEKVKTALTHGMSQARATQTIAHLEKLVADAAAKTVAATPAKTDNLPF